jgi:hypothetical protein
VVVKINCGHESFIWSLIKLELVRSEDFVFNSAIRSVYGQGDDDRGADAHMHQSVRHGALCTRRSTPSTGSRLLEFLGQFLLLLLLC